MPDHGDQLTERGQPLLPKQGFLPILNALDHVVEGAGQRAHFIVVGDGGSDAQIALAYLHGGAGQGADWLRDAPRHGEGGEHDDKDADHVDHNRVVNFPAKGREELAAVAFDDQPPAHAGRDADEAVGGQHGDAVVIEGLDDASLASLRPLSRLRLGAVLEGLGAIAVGQGVLQGDEDAAGFVDQQGLAPHAQSFAGVKQRLQCGARLDFRDHHGDGMAVWIPDGPADVKDGLVALAEKMRGVDIVVRLPQRLLEERPAGHVRPQVGRQGGSENPSPPGIGKEDAAVLGIDATDVFQPIGQRSKFGPLPQLLPERLPWESAGGQAIYFRQNRQQQGPPHRRPHPDP